MIRRNPEKSNTASTGSVVIALIEVIASLNTAASSGLVSRYSKKVVPRNLIGAGSPVLTECSRLPQCSHCAGSPTSRTKARVEPGASARNASPIGVSANVSSRRCSNTPLPASARISRKAPSGSAPTRRATSAAFNGPPANSSGMPSLAATYKACVVQLPFAISNNATLPGTILRVSLFRPVRTPSTTRTRRTGGVLRLSGTGRNDTGRRQVVCVPKGYRPIVGTVVSEVLVQVVAQHLRTAGVPQLRHRLRLDLADPLAGHAVDLADLVEGTGLAVGEAEPQPHHACLALGERLEHRLQLILKQRERHRVHGHHGLGVFDEVTELAVAFVADGLVQRNRLTRVLLDLQHLLRRDVHFLGELFWRGLATQILEQLTLDAPELVDHLDHVHRDADGARLVGHGARDRLADPPRGVRGELVALGVVELLDRTDQAKVAFLDEVEEGHAAAGVALGQRDDEAQVRLEQVVLRAVAVTADPGVVATLSSGQLLALFGELRHQLRGVQPGFDPLGELDFLLGVEQRHLADLLEVGAHRVRRSGELGVLAGLSQGLGFLFVPDEVARGLVLLGRLGDVFLFGRRSGHGGRRDGLLHTVGGSF